MRRLSQQRSEETVVDRRFIGCVLVTIMLVCALTVPGMIGRNVTGDGAPTVHPRAIPKVGQCLAPLDMPDQLNTVFDSVPIVPCSQPHSAEILAVGVLPHKTYPVRPTIADAGFTSGELSQQCDRLAAKFLGWGNKSAPARIQVSFFSRLTVPGDLEWHLGQRWYACEVMPGVLDYPISYSGSARGASFRTPPGAFANCSDGPGLLAVSCDRPHHAEQLTRTYHSRNTSSATSTAEECKQLVSRIIGTADPTFGGQLAVLARVEGGANGCWVITTGTRSLTATLINHGSGPLPLS
jgi:hypothetical protein